MNSAKLFRFRLVAVLFAIAGIATAQAQISMEEDIVWKDFTKTGASYPSGGVGSALTRLLATSAAWDGDAVSDKYIFGDGYVQWRFTRPGKRVIVGLDSADPSSGYGSMQYAIFSTAGSPYYAEIRQNGSVPAGAPTNIPVTATKIFKIKRTRSTIEYYAYEPTDPPPIAPVYTSKVPSQGALLVDTSFYDLDAQIDRCRYFGEPAPEDVIWTSFAGMSPTYPTGSAGSSLYMWTTTGYDCGATSNKVITGDGHVQFRFGQVSKRCAIGLGASDANTQESSIDFAVRGREDGKYEIVEQGVTKTGLASYTVGDVFRIERVGGVVKYYRHNPTTLLGDVLIYTSTLPNAGNQLGTKNLLVDTWSATNDATLTNVQYDGTPLSEPIRFILTAETDVTTSAKGTILSKRATAAAGWINAYARSAKTMLGSGSVSWTFPQINKTALVGLATGASGNAFADVKYGLCGRADGTLEIYEAGASVGLFGSYAATDQLTVRRLGSQIEYLKNQTVLRRVTAISGRLAAHVALYEPTAAVNDLIQYGVPDDVIWRECVGVTPTEQTTNGSTLTRGTTTAAWNAGAIGSRLLIGNGYLEFRFGQTNKYALVGFSKSDPDQGNTTIDYGIIGGVGTFNIHENGASLGSYGTYTTSDVFRISRTGNIVTYYKNDTLLRTSNYIFSPSPPLLVDSSLNGTNAVVNQVQLYWQDRDSDGMNDEWEIARFGDLLRTGSANDDQDEYNDLGEFFQGTNPLAWDYMAPPTLSIISGNGQSGPAGAVVADPLVVRVTNSLNEPLDKAPVTFSITRGDGAIASSGGVFAQQLSTFTDQQGYASIQFRMPIIRNKTSLVQAELSPISLGKVTFVEGLVYEDDSDGDGMPDGWEALNNLEYLTFNAAEDLDGDGLSNLAEYQRGTLPRDDDSDGDGLPDGWEVAAGGDPLADDTARDSNQNGLTNAEEYALSATLRGAWEFNATTGTVAVDTSGGGNNGTLVNGPVWTADPSLGGVLGFDGVDDRVQVPDPSNGALDFGTGDFALSFAFKSTSLNSSVLVTKSSDTPTAGYEARLVAGKIEFRLSASTQAETLLVTTDSAYNDGQWHAVAISVDQGAKTLRIYIDGIPQVLTKATGTFGTLINEGLAFSGNVGATASTTDPLVFGGRASATQSFSGALEQMHLFQKPLSESEAASLAGSLKNQRPFIVFVNPPGGKLFPAGPHLLQANAADADGTIAKVSFYDSYTIIGTDLTAPWQGTWTSPASGQRTLRAVGHDNRGGANTASTIVEILADVLDNGLPDEWEEHYFGNYDQTPGGDYDFDGVLNIDEFRLGRDPTKGAVSDPNNSVGLKVFTPLF